MKRIGKAAVIATALLLPGARHRPEPLLRLGLPLACRIGTDCAVQRYVDDGGGGDPHDFLCRWRTVPGQEGTAFRIPSLARMHEGVPVIASAPGRVLRVTDGLADMAGDTRGTAGSRCGNTVVVDDGHGWQTQYCHLAKGSLRTRPGRHVRTGTPLGFVGTSGDTGFPQVELIVRKDGRVVDPFAYDAAPGSCGGGRMMWRYRIAYQSGQVLVAGFAARPVTMADALAEGTAQQPRPTGSSPSLVAFVQSIGLEKGDIQKLAIFGPDARVIASTEAAPLDHDEAQAIVEAGTRRPAGGWPAGIYQANYAVRRGGVDVILRSFQISM